jgi:hypothetical protein
VSFGLTVAAIGDMNGDGVADLGIGAPRENGMGVVRLYTGSLGRSQQQNPLVKYNGSQANARFGEAIAGGGDIDGDGIGDYVIGEPGWDGGQTDEGRFALYYGSRLGIYGPPTYVEANIVGAALGASVSPFRDVNWDGFADVAVGAPGAAGRVYMFMGSSVGMRNYLEPVDYNTFSTRNFHPGRSHDPDQLAATFFYHVAGQGRSKTGFELEVKPSSAPFDGIPTSLSGSDTFDSGIPGSVVPTFAINYLGGELPGRTFKMRGRWTTKNPLFPRSRWITPDAHTSGDHDEWITGLTVGVPATSAGALRIESVAPNPSSLSSVVSFTLPVAGHVSLDVFDLRGARVRRLLSGTRPAGPSSIAWDGKSDDGRVAAAGVYMIVLRSGEAVQRAKLVRLP